MTDEKILYPDVAERIRWHRKEFLKMTQAEYASSINATGRQVGNWESGISRPTQDCAILMRRNYGLSLDWLLVGDDTHLPLELMRAWRSRSNS